MLPENENKLKQENEGFYFNSQSSKSIDSDPLLYILNLCKSSSKNIKNYISKHSTLILGLVIILIILMEGSKMRKLGIIENSFSIFVDSVLNGILVFVTIVYASLTKDALEDGRKNREIEFIQRQLEYFYYPLLRTMEKAELASVAVMYRTYGNDNYNRLSTVLDVLRKDMETLYKYQYLSSQSIRDKLLPIEQYISYIPIESNAHKAYVDENFLYNNQEKIYNQLSSFKDDLKSEIETINNNLINLVN